MLSIDPWNILWTVVNLLVLYLVFKKFLFKPVMKVINAREDMIKQQFDDAKKSQEEADALKASYDEKLESAKTEADEIIVNARNRAQEEHEAALEKTRKETEVMLEKAKADIATEKEKATEAAQAGAARDGRVDFRAPQRRCRDTRHLPFYQRYLRCGGHAAQAGRYSAHRQERLHQSAEGKRLPQPAFDCGGARVLLHRQRTGPRRDPDPHGGDGFLGEP